MAKANFVLTNGTKVDIEGSPDEITALLAHYAGTTPGAKPARSRSTDQKTPAVKKEADGAKARIRDLILDGFFADARPLKAVRDKLAEQGHIHQQKELSARLIELTKSRELRRFQEKDIWVYVNR